MKIQPDRSDKLTITAYSDSWIAVNGLKYPHNLLVNSNGQILQWKSISFENIVPEEWDFLSNIESEILILGSWKRLLAPPQPLLFKLLQKGIGVENMDTAAACRTFNVLANEGRKVCAILLLTEKLSENH